MPLYKTQSPYTAAVSAMGNAAGTAASMTKKTETKYHEPEKTLGGGLASGIGGAWAGMQAAEYMEPGTSKALYHALGDMFSAPTNAAANAGAAQAMTTGAEAAKAGLMQGIGGSASAEGLGAVTAAATPAATALQSAPVVAGAAQNMATGGAAATGAAVSGTSAAGMAGTAAGAAGMAGAGAAGAAAGTTAAATGAATTAATTGAVTAGAASAGGAAAGATTGASAGSTAGPVGAGVGALVGLAAGLLSYYL